MQHSKGMLRVLVKVVAISDMSCFCTQRTNLESPFKSPMQPFARHLDEFTYASFSEGEKARIDLALLFTWRKIAELKNSVSTNLLILDEVFDGSLDAIGADEVMAKLLFKQSQHFDGQIRDTQRDNTNVFVISHKVDLIDKFNETIKFEKVRGFSKMV